MARKIFAAFALLLTTVAGLSPGAGATDSASVDSRGRTDLTLTILHNNDGESQLINAGEDAEEFGGVARFGQVVTQQKVRARRGNKTEFLFVSSGDNFLAGPEFQASLNDGEFYDAEVLGALDYDAIQLGNHDFDFGPQVLADFINSYKVRERTPYLASNLDFSAEPALQALADKGRITSSTIVKKGRYRIGVVGAVTPELDRISSPGGVVVQDNIAEIIQAEVDALTEQGIKYIVLISHLQGIDADIGLAAELTDVDVVVAGGGDEVLANDGDLLVPGDVPFASYPIIAVDAENREVPVVTTAGDYKYLGRLAVEFDAAGNVLSFDGSPIRVASKAFEDGVSPKAKLTNIVKPVGEFLAELDTRVVGVSEVALEGRRDPGIRTAEQNLGNLMADSLLAAGRANAAAFGVAAPDVAIQNGGGIRNNNLLPAGTITEKTTFDIAPFGNFVTVVPDISRAQLKQLLERGFSETPAASGRFPQVAGMTVTYDPSGTAQELDADDAISVPGEKVQSIVLDDGTVLVENGSVVDGPDIAVATIDFLARGGDGYPYNDAPFAAVGLSYQQALRNYIAEDLGGVISSADYPEGGEGRIVAVGVPN